MKRPSRHLVILACVACVVTLGAVGVWTLLGASQTFDQNGDGRPDVWRHFDVRGQVTQVDIDSNFDGRPDVEEYYERGVLVRRESDRNFNGQADLVEEFDAETSGETRSVIDTDFDGTADRLVLYRDGLPVFSRRACPGQTKAAPQQADDATGRRLVALIDPFESDPAVRAAHRPVSDQAFIGLSTSGGLPAPRAAVLRQLPSASRIIAVAPTALARPSLLLRSPRAPPLV